MKSTNYYYQSFAFETAGTFYAQETVEVPEGSPTFKNFVTPPGQLYKKKPHLKPITTASLGSKPSTVKPMLKTQTSEALHNGMEALAAVFPSKDSRPSVRTLHRMADAGQVPVYRGGKHRFYRISEVSRAFTRAAGELSDDELARLSEGAAWAEVSRVCNEQGQAAADALINRMEGRRRFVCDVAVSKLDKMSVDKLWETYSAIEAAQGADAARCFYKTFLEGK